MQPKTIKTMATATTQASAKILQAYEDLKKKAEEFRKAANYGKTVASQFKRSGYDYEVQYLEWSCDTILKACDKVSADYEKVKRV